ncbi:MAG: high frequency lysogenization protein HflD [Pseudomonadota bacterium]
MTSIEDKTLALAGVAQACKQVRSIATRGSYDQDILLTAIQSILSTEPSSTEEVYGKKSALNSGLRIITNYNFAKNNHDLELTKTIITTLSLSSKLLKRNDLLNKLNSGIEKAKDQVEFFTADHDNVISNLADLYQNTISTMSPKILVAGNPVYLEQADNASRVRTLLLAAVRSGILWHQLGGTRWQLLFQRKNIMQAAHKLLNPFNN